MGANENTHVKIPSIFGAADAVIAIAVPAVRTTRN
jgi:hypothetical protein